MNAASDLHAQWRAASIVSLDQLLGAGPVLVLAPHPDDESLGCGGLIASLCQRGRPPLVAILTDGAGSHPNSRSHPPDRVRMVRQEEARDAVTALGLRPDRLHFMGFADTRLPHGGASFDAMVRAVSALVAPGDRGTILAPWRHDPHGDHVAADGIARAVAARSGWGHLAYPVWGWTLDAATCLPRPRGGQAWRLEIGEHLPAKRRAVAAHRSQHGKVITDDPDGFTLPADFLALFDGPYEVFLRP